VSLIIDHDHLFPDNWLYVIDGSVIRQYKAYPVYDGEYRQHLQVLQDYVESFENLQTVGRNGMHRYNNQDHSMLTALLAAKNILGEQHNLWNVNVEMIATLARFSRSKAESTRRQ
jgi:protoporphyrinogen oxidase